MTDIKISRLKPRKDGRLLGRIKRERTFAITSSGEKGGSGRIFGELPGGGGGRSIEVVLRKKKKVKGPKTAGKR